MSGTSMPGDAMRPPRSVAINRGKNRLRRSSAVLVATALALAGFGAVAPAPAHADTTPAEGLPATVSADALPTWQVNGVVWSQVVVGTTVYATGSFTKARPPGVAAGGAGEVDAGNIFAYDIRTGNRVSTFAHTLNGQGRAITASPSGDRVYVGGDFTTVDNLSRGHVAAFSTSNGALDTAFAPNVSNQVRALAASPSTVYIGGSYGAVNGATRNNLAAVSSTTGALSSWAPKAEGGTVWSMVLAPDGSRVIVGGSFTSLSGTAAYGMGSVSTTGAIMPWAATEVIRSAGAKGGITSLRTDGTQIYGTGYSFETATANFEGTFAAAPDTGKISVLNDCHGDTYDILPMGSVMYSVGHPHECTAVGSFPDTNPRVRWQRALAQTIAPTTRNVGPDSYGWNFDGQPASTILQWFPAIPAGSYTGQGQGAWSMAGNSDYVVMGGEFPRVNGVAQQGLTRMARTGLAPNKVGPSYTTNPARPVPATTASSFAPGTARVAFGTAWDYDNESLTYEVLRDGAATPVYTTQVKSNFWTLPTAGFIDTGLAPGSTHSYQVRIKDPAGNLLWSPKSNTVTISSGSPSKYAAGVAADGAAHFWRLGEPSGPTAYDWTAFDDLNLTGGFTRGAPGAITGDSDGSSTFDGTGTATDPNAIVGPDVFSQEAWFRTNSSTGGKIVSFGNQMTGDSNSYDRQIYMDAAGRVYFGVYNGGVYTTRTTNSLNDGAWHHVVSTLDGTGLTLYVDGKKASHNSGTTGAQPYTGYWRVGGDNINGWGADGGYFNGDIDDVAIYANSLTADQVAKHYTDSGRTVAVPPKPADAYGLAVYNSNPDLYWRLGETSGTVAADSTSNEANGVYSGGVTPGAAGAVAGTTNTAVTLNGGDGAVAAGTGVSNPTVYSEELWFKTTTDQGGKLIGFGTNQTGPSSGYDRHVYMFNDGRLRFGVWTGETNVIDSADAYNDGTWHHLVATQGADGMKMFVDSVLVGTNAQTQAQAYDGYWRVGGDNTWGGNTSSYFAGSIDEVAVYSTALSAATVKTHFQAGGGSVPNAGPTAAFSSSSAGLKATFDGADSSDADGTIASYGWDFGDGTPAGSGVSPSHTYATAGTFTVILSVTDDKGATATTSHDVTVAPAPNQAPTAAFTSSVVALKATFDGSDSSDVDGNVASYAWDFGDGSAPGTGTTPEHTYAAAGTYTVKLTVTDDKGATASVSHDVTAVAANEAPSAAFSSAATLLKVAFDGSGSSDPDGTVDSYAWDFGDTTAAGSGVSPSHTYASAGTYTVRLTVTDNKGATNLVTHDVTVTAPIASDAFARTVTNGWGTADVGGVWTNSSTSSNFAVANGAATLKTLAGAGPSAYLKGVSAADVDVTSSVGYDTAPTGGGIYTAMVARRVSTSDYRANLRSTATGTTLSVARTMNGTETAVSSQSIPGLVSSPGTVLNVRFQVQGTGSTTLRAKVWKSGTTEPPAWQVTASDTTAALQTAGSVGIYSYVSGSATSPVTLSVRGYKVVALG